jgi:hypothetical protein
MPLCDFAAVAEEVPSHEADSVSVILGVGSKQLWSDVFLRWCVGVLVVTQGQNCRDTECVNLWR